VRALVTGSAGFLGRHFVTELERRGWEVTDVDIEGRSQTDCRLFFDYYRDGDDHYDLVVHCAAVVGGRAVIDGSPLETAVNLELDAAMFRWAARAKPKRVLYISSSAAYPVSYQDAPDEREARPVRLLESMTQPGGEYWTGMPDQVYGWSKVVGEVLAGRLREAGVPVTVVRPFSGYGWDQDASYPFRAFLDRALRREDPFRLWCGDCVRDFIHVDDVVNGALAVVADGTTDPVNLCTGTGTSFMELARTVCDAVGYSPEIVPDPAAPSGVAYRVGDPDRLRWIYTPQVSLETGVLRSLQMLGDGS
jgi:nucleoside-diphosphate-sugar epimerase